MRTNYYLEKVETLLLTEKLLLLSHCFHMSSAANLSKCVYMFERVKKFIGTFCEFHQVICAVFHIALNITKQKCERMIDERNENIVTKGEVIRFEHFYHQKSSAS